MILSGHQPCYLPGIIVFSKIALSDAFMFVGHCDYQHRSYHSHNLIRGPRGPLQLTVPVVRESGPSINEKLIDGDRWKKKHLASIKHTYGKRPHFKEYFPAIEREIMEPAWKTLALLNNALICLILDWLGISRAPNYTHPTMLEWSGSHITGHKTEMLFNMCKATGASEYLSSPGETYVIPKQMKPYKHHFQQFTHPVYDQGAEFIPNLSVIDLLFNVGPRAGEIVRGAGKIGPENN